MKVQYFFIFILCALAWQCSNHDNEILDINTMKKVMLHKIMAEERFINYLQRDTLFNEDSVLTDLFGSVLAYHKTDSATFYRSLEYYKKNPEKFNVLLDSLSNYAQQERDRQYLKINPPEPISVEDSVVRDSAEVDSTIFPSKNQDSISLDSAIKE
jgi:hypothetical protein